MNVISLIGYSYLLIFVHGNQGVCYKDDKCQKATTISNFRYLFYDVNPSEGFNLRRDVYMRMAVLTNELKHSKDPHLNNFVLVLPPWSHLIHWGYSEEPEYASWSRFFDLNSLQKFAPVIELHEYFSRLHTNKYTRCIIDTVYVLQHFEEMFKSGNFEDKWEIEKCQKLPKLRFFYYTNITSYNVQCLSFHGPSTKLIEVFKQDQARSIMLEHAEIALHNFYGNDIYWRARRSMRFNMKLREIANEFRRTYLNSTDESDNTFLAPDWRDDKPKRSAKGGPYLAVHLRRRDFLRSRPDQVPDLVSVAEQVSTKLEELQLSKVFFATDAPAKEFEQLHGFLSSKYEVFKYTPTKDIERKYSAGGVAIIDQILCSYARYFVGTSDSTFSYRIREEREIIGFPTKMTFNVLCKNKDKCEKPSVWKIVF
ncbi:GDP-fucose protein O-fucosyltransferase 2 [Euwallacea similis]|uniref:GDP-fucose protein O-fucosyltransferase 2 n=1 Tax=Euwallacea similis TaxID=1736056 RepID=UPI00344E99BD